MIGVILGGGTGSRLVPLTKAINKHLLPVYDRPLIYYSLELFAALGIDDVIIITNTGDHAAQLSRQIGPGGNFGPKSISFICQEKPLGTAHALSLCETFARNRGPIIVGWADNIFEYVPERFIETFSGGAKILVKNVASTKNYGRVVFENGKLNNILPPDVEVHQSGYALTGLFMFDESVFSYINEVEVNQKNELDLVDALRAYLIHNEIVAEEVQGYWLDVAYSIDSLYQAGQLVKSYGANKRSISTSNLNGSAEQRVAELIDSNEQSLLALENEILLSSDLGKIEHLAAETARRKLEIAKLKIEESQLRAADWPQGLLSLRHSQNQRIAPEALHVLESFRSAKVKIFAEAAEIDSLIVDGTLLLVASSGYRGWTQQDVMISVEDVPSLLSAELEEIRIAGRSELDLDRFVDNKLYSLRSYVPPQEGLGVLKVKLSFLSFFDYYSVWRVAHEPTKVLESGRKMSIVEKYGPRTIKLLQTPGNNVALPTIINIQCAVVTSDQYIILMKRSPTVGFVPGHWSASFEETMTIEDSDFHTAALRGYEEEFGEMAAKSIIDFKVLSLNFEYHSLAVTIGCILRTNDTCDQVRSSWLLARDKHEASKIEFIPFGLGETTWSLFEQKRLWHPSSRKRLIEALFNGFGIDATLAALYSTYLDRKRSSIP